MKLVEVFRACKRVLKNDGTLWLNLGDSYAGSGNGSNDYRENGSSLSKDDRKYKGQKPGFDFGGQGETSKVSKLERGKGSYSGYDIKAKDLIGIPWLVAFALRADGWYLRKDIIWNKPNPMPESVKDRPTTSHEYIFLLSKNAEYYYDYRAILDPANYDGRKDTKFKGGAKYKDFGQEFQKSGHERWPNTIRGFKTKTQLPDNQHHGKDVVSNYGLSGTGFDGHSGNYDADGNLLTYDIDGVPARNKRSVWTVSTKPYKEAHFATYPPDLIEPCILAGCPEGGVVLDPFNGAGTTGVVAIKNKRDYIGIELNPEYVRLTEKRLKSVQVKLL